MQFNARNEWPKCVSKTWRSISTWIESQQLAVRHARRSASASIHYLFISIAIYLPGPTAGVSMAAALPAALPRELPGRNSSPCHGLQSNAPHDGSQGMSITWRAISARRPHPSARTRARMCCPGRIPLIGPGRYCSPLYSMHLNSRDVNLNCVPMVWRAVSGKIWQALLAHSEFLAIHTTLTPGYTGTTLCSLRLVQLGLRDHGNEEKASITLAAYDR